MKSGAKHVVENVHDESITWEVKALAATGYLAEALSNIDDLRKRCGKLHRSISHQRRAGNIHGSMGIDDTDWLTELFDMAKGN